MAATLKRNNQTKTYTDSSPWYSDSWYDNSHVISTDESIPEATVATCDDNATDMNNMFDGCSSLTSLDLSSFDTSSTTDMSCMFSDCSI